MDFKTTIENCKSNKQVLQAIKKYGYTITRDTSDDLGVFSVWLDDTTRIYESRRGYVLQKWQKYKLNIVAYPHFLLQVFNTTPYRHKSLYRVFSFIEK